MGLVLHDQRLGDLEFQNLHEETDRDFCLSAADKADVIIEGFRPGVMERLALGPDVILERNPRMVYGRVTGWGQQGPLAGFAGHDINYIALGGALEAMSLTSGPPRPPLNLVGDFGGGSLFLAFGIMAALWERNRSGRGQVVDAAIVDGVASMMSMFTGFIPSDAVSTNREQSLLGGDAPFYRCYRCSDGLDIAVGALEPRFYNELLDRIEAPLQMREAQYTVANWQARSQALSALFATKTRDEWRELLESTDACFAPVLSIAESQAHPHMRSRQTYVELNGVTQNAPAPRFSRTPGVVGESGAGIDALKRWEVPLSGNRQGDR